MADEELTLDGLALHSSPFTLEAFEHKPAKKLLEWLKGPDSDGAKLLRFAKHENAEINLRVRVERQATQDVALSYVGQIVDKLQEAERQAAGGRGRGLELVWSPVDSTFNGTFYVLAGEVDVPKVTSGDDVGYLWRFPVINISLICHPFMYGTEGQRATVTSSLPLITLTVPDEPGDVPSEVRVNITDASGVTADYAAVGLENFHYDSLTSLLHGSGVFVISGFAGTSTTRAGSSSTNVIRASLTTSAVAVCGSGELTHKGSFRNVFRLWPSSANVSVRMVWRQGRDQWTAEPWQTVPAGGKWCEVDLGQCKVRPALLGTQTWQWKLEAKSTVAGDSVDVDYHAMIPSGEGYGKARKVVAFESATAFSVRDEFDQTAGNLNAKTLPVGGTWATSGSATDLAVETTGKTAQKTAVSEAGRYAIAGTGTFTNVVAQMDAKVTSAATSASWVSQGLVVRWTDASTHLLFGVGGLGGAGVWTLTQSSAGTTVLASGSYSRNSGAWHTFRVVVYASGRVYVWASPQGGTPVLLGTAQSTALATGGALATGKVGFVDNWPDATAATRNYDNFSAFAPVEDAVCFANQSIEFRSFGDDPILREDSTGTYWGRPPESRGGRLWLPPGGEDDRTSRVAVLMRDSDIETQGNETVARSRTVTAHARSRYLVIPRQA